MPKRLAVGVGDQIGLGPDTLDAIGLRAEAVEDGRNTGEAAALLPELEHRAAKMRPASSGGAEEVAMAVGDQARLGIRAVGAVEVGPNGRCSGEVSARLLDLEHRTHIVRPAARGRAEEVAQAVGNEAGLENRAVGPEEFDQVGWGRGKAVARPEDLKHRALTARAAPPVVPKRSSPRQR